MNWCASPEVSYELMNVTPKEFSKSPPEPFTTSTLQQESSKKLRYSPAHTMSICQKLYERGLITYMRTDSSIMSDIAHNAATTYVRKEFGEKYLGTNDDRKKTQVAKNAQEAHECIRPVISANGDFFTPEILSSSLTSDELSVFRLIFERAIASIMAPSRSLTITSSVKATGKSKSNDAIDKSRYSVFGSESIQSQGITEAIFKHSNTRVLFDGYLGIYNDNHKHLPITAKVLPSSLVGRKMHLTLEIGESMQDTGKNTDDEVVADQDSPTTKKGNTSSVTSCDTNSALETVSHETRPISRYTEASFIKLLEDIGVGRPSTYSSIIQTLKDREYITVDQQTIIPTIKGMIVCKLLQDHFPDIISPNFTSRMEACLDEIARGELDKVTFLTNYYFGSCDSNSDNSQPGLAASVEQKLNSDTLDQSTTRDLPMPDMGVVLHFNKDGSYVTRFNSTSDERWKLPNSMLLDMRAITRDNLESIMQGETTQGSNLGVNENNLPISLRSGRYGRYIQIGHDKAPRHEKQIFAIPKYITHDTCVNNLKGVMEFSRLPTEIGLHPVLKIPVIAMVKNEEFCIEVKGYPLRVKLPESCAYFPHDIDDAVIMTYLGKSEEILKSQLCLGVSESHGNLPVFVKKGKFGYYVQCGSTIA
jgi:DNA topoisomerase-1